jgi:hypothetical protein
MGFDEDVDVVPAEALHAQAAARPTIKEVTRK